MGEPSEAVEPAAVVAALYEELDRQRAAGRYPIALEEQVDLAFARSLPRVADAMAGVLQRLEETSAVNADPPTESTSRGGRATKQLVWNLTAWYQRFLAQQITELGHAVTDAIRAIDVRVAALEAPVHAVRTELAVARRAPFPERARPLIAAAMRGCPGRVLHADADDGRVVSDLVAAGVDAYGVDPLVRSSAHLALGPAVWRTTAVDHLRQLPEAALGGFVLSGSIDAAPPGDVVDVLDQAERVLAPGGTMVVVTVHPLAWSVRPRSVAEDLGLGHPLQAGTWHHLLTARGFSVDDVGELRDTATAGSSPGDDAVASHTVLVARR